MNARKVVLFSVRRVYPKGWLFGFSVAVADKCCGLMLNFGPWVLWLGPHYLPPKP